MKSTTTKSRNPVQAAAGPPDRRGKRRSDRGNAAARGDKQFYRPEFNVHTADLLDADFVPGYN